MHGRRARSTPCWPSCACCCLASRRAPLCGPCWSRRCSSPTACPKWAATSPRCFCRCSRKPFVCTSSGTCGGPGHTSDPWCSLSGSHSPLATLTSSTGVTTCPKFPFLDIRNRFYFFSIDGKFHLLKSISLQLIPLYAMQDLSTDKVRAAAISPPACFLMNLSRTRLPSHRHRILPRPLPRPRLGPGTSWPPPRCCCATRLWPSC